MTLVKKTALWIAARGLLAERGADFFRCWERTAASFDAEDIHDLRVASRRLREGLALFSPCYPRKKISRLRGSIRKITDILGDLRNIDEGLAFFRAEAGELGNGQGEELARCIQLYEKNREEARKDLKRDLRRMNPRTLRKMFVRTVHAPYLFDPPPGAADPFAAIEDFAREKIDLRLEPVLALIPVARRPEEAAAQHRLRIAIKRYRYRLEVLSPLMGEGYRDVHAQVKAYQEILGRLHDLDVFRELIRGIGLTAGTEQALAGLIAEKREGAFGQFQDMLGKTPFDSIGVRVRSLL
ncbi:MAG: CHAD domain-containing protein [Geobacteraceae bacterium]|nr:CHAD domain-containing protein [Geobacteraceae bacterium]